MHTQTQAMAQTTTIVVDVTCTHPAKPSGIQLMPSLLHAVVRTCRTYHNITLLQKFNNCARPWYGSIYKISRAGSFANCKRSTFILYQHSLPHNRSVSTVAHAHNRHAFRGMPRRLGCTGDTQTKILNLPCGTPQFYKINK